MNQEIKKLKIMIELKEHIIDSLVRESQGKTKEIDLIKTALKAKEDKIIELTKRIFAHSEIGTRNAELKLENQTLRTELIEAKQKNLACVKERDQMKANFVSEKQTLTTSLKRHSLIITKQTGVIEKAQNDYKTLVNINDSLNAQSGKIADLQSQIRFDKQRIEGAKNRIKRFHKAFVKKLVELKKKIRTHRNWELCCSQFHKLRNLIDSDMSKVIKELAEEKVVTLDTEDDDLVGDEMEEEGSVNGASSNEEVGGDEMEEEGSQSVESSNEEVSGDEMEEEGSQSGGRSNEEPGGKNSNGDEMKEESSDDDVECTAEIDYTSSTSYDEEDDSYRVFLDKLRHKQRNFTRNTQ